jgi:protein-L-isoaspartate(D-aspartate) O-methyltransferase
MLLLLAAMASPPPAAGGGQHGPADESGFSDREERAYARQREAMVDGPVRRLGVHEERVLDALRTVPRHRFVPRSSARHAYADMPIPIGHGQTISAPDVVGLMSQLLAVGPGDRVLEIGTGSGYQAAVLAEMGCEVHSIEIVAPLAETARARLDAVGYETVRTREGDGWYGWEEAAPFAGVIVTAAADHVPPPLVRQLAPGGRMVIPVGPAGAIQDLLVVEKKEDGGIVTRSVLPVRFVPFVRGR